MRHANISDCGWSGLVHAGGADGFRACLCGETANARRSAKIAANFETD